MPVASLRVEIATARAGSVFIDRTLECLAAAYQWFDPGSDAGLRRHLQLQLGLEPLHSELSQQQAAGRVRGRYGDVGAEQSMTRSANWSSAQLTRAIGTAF